MSRYVIIMGVGGSKPSYRRAFDNGAKGYVESMLEKTRCAPPAAFESAYQGTPSRCAIYDTRGRVHVSAVTSRDLQPSEFAYRAPAWDESLPRSLRVPSDQRASAAGAAHASTRLRAASLCPRGSVPRDDRECASKKNGAVVSRLSKPRPLSASNIMSVRLSSGSKSPGRGVGSPSQTARTGAARTAPRRRGAGR